MVEHNRSERSEAEPREDSFTLQLPKPFASSFVEEAHKAFDASPFGEVNRLLGQHRPRMGVEAMWVEFYSTHPRQIFKALEEGAMRGFDIEIHRDWYSKNLTDEDFLWLPPTAFVDKQQKHHRMWVSGFTQERFEMLKDYGAKCIDTNVPKNQKDKALYLFKGRDHKKIYFITHPEGMVAWVGGMNLAREHFEQIDFMVKITDSRIVTGLIEEFDHVNETRRQESVEVPCTQQTSILIDALGDKSKIVDKAIEDIDAASNYVYVSSALTPSGRFLDALHRAHTRGVHVVYLTSNPKVAGLLLGSHEKLSEGWAKIKGKKIPLIFPEKRMVHAKALIVDGKAGYIGSSNFREDDHEELSLRSTNKELIESVEEFFGKVVGGENLRRKLVSDLVIPDPAGFN